METIPFSFFLGQEHFSEQVWKTTSTLPLRATKCTPKCYTSTALATFSKKVDHLTSESVCETTYAADLSSDDTVWTNCARTSVDKNDNSRVLTLRRPPLDSDHI